MDDIFGDSPRSEVRAEDLVGEGKKFKTVDDLAKGKAEADRYIEELKTKAEAAERRLAEAANAEAQLAELREQLKAEQKRTESTPPRTEPTAKDIEAIVEETITRAEARKTAAQNIGEANRLMTEHFGDPQKAGAEVATRAKELGLTIDDLKGIAARSPSAFKKLILGDTPKPVESPAAPLGRSTVNPNAVNLDTGAPKVGTKEYYQQMLRKDPRRYASPETQKEILQHTIAGTYVP